jgi:hypothetical protein
MLHVTNGSSVSLDASGLGGEVLVWADVLHEGPVPSRLNPDELTRVRSAFLDSLWPGERPASEGLAARDRTLAEHAAHGEVTLWFEHDLFDQLQLIQILDWFRGHESAIDRLRLICIDTYLGRLTGSQLANLWPHRKRVTPAELELASEAWRAFRSPDPTDIERVLRADTSALPFLAGALLRHLQQFPSVENGLARTERQILELIDAGQRDFGSLFPADQLREERIFMGDCVFYRYLRGLCDCRHALVREERSLEDRSRFALTPVGREVLAGQADHIRLNGINRWLGGVHLHGPEALWRWNEAAGKLVPH